MALLNLYKTDAPLVLDEPGGDLRTLSEQIHDHCEPIGYWFQTYHHSKPAPSFLQDFVERLGCDALTEEEYAQRERRVEEIKGGDALTEHEIALFDE